MASQEFAGYVLVGLYALVFMGALKAFGPVRVLRVICVVVFAGVWMAFATVRAIAGRSH